LDQPDIWSGGGELGALMRDHDWASTPLGAPLSWPQSLKTAVRIMLTSRQPIWIGWGEDLIYLYNDAYRSIIGGRHPWALGRPTREVWPEIWPDIGPMLATAMGGVEGTYVEQQLLIMERHGYPEETYYTFSYSPIPDDDGSPGGIICANTDDTQRVISERQNVLLRELAAETGSARSWNEACERGAAAFRLNPQDLPVAAIHMLDRESGALTLAAAHGLEPGHVLAPHELSPDGEVFEVLRSGQPTLIADLRDRYGPLAATDGNEPVRQAVMLSIPAVGARGRPGVLTVGLNPFRQLDDGYRGFLTLVAGQIAAAVSNADTFQDERRRAQALEEIDQAKTAFFSNVSHEFRTPLTLMLGPLEDVLNTADTASEVRAQVEVAYRNGLRMLKLVNSLLDFSRIEAGRSQALYRPVELGQLVLGLAASFQSAVDRAGLTLDIQVQPNLEPVYVDTGMIEKIVLNLLSNAFKFTWEGAITVTVGPGRQAGTIEISIADTGVGIPAHEIPRLFERFHRVQGAKGRSFEGSGIGLALVHELVQLHGGALEVNSREGEGSVFRVTLPLGSAHLPPEHVAPEAAAAQASNLAQAYVEESLRWLPGGLAAEPLDAPAPGGVARRRILLADDNADMRDYVAHLLVEAGFEVERVADGVAALEAMRTAIPDLVLTDVMMPRLDGVGLLRAIRVEPSWAGVPVIMLSARAGEEASIEGLKAGADDYLSKPFAARELLARVTANLALADARREAAAAVADRNRELERLNATLEQRVSQALAERKILADIVGGTDAFVQVADLDYRWLAINRAAADEFERVFGVRPAVGLSMFEALADQPEHQAAVRSVWSRAMAGEEFTQIGEFGDPQRTRRVYEMKFNVLRDEDGRRIGAFQFVYDVTERIREQERLAQAEDQLRQAQKMEAMGQLTGGVAHDFNNLLTPIIGALDLLQRSKAGGEREHRLIAGALQSADRAKILVQRLLAFARRQPLQATSVNVGALVQGMAELISSVTGPQIQVLLEVEPDLPAAKADPNQLEMAILNLSVNARDAMADGGVIRMSVTDEIVLPGQRPDLAPGGYVRLSVADTGHGMDEATLARAIEPFFSTKGIGKGTGLGLSMVHGLVRQLGGGLTLHSRPGLGTNIELWLPRSDEPKRDVEAPRDPIASQTSKGAVLVVDDEELVRISAADMLEELGYSVVQAASAEEAIRLLEGRLRPDLVVTDHLMPGLTGVDLARVVKARLPQASVLVMSGYADLEGLDPDLPRLTKPFLISDLSAAISALS